MKKIALTFALFAPFANLLAGSTDSVQTPRECSRLPR